MNLSRLSRLAHPALRSFGESGRVLARPRTARGPPAHLAGRYRHFRLHPFLLNEIAGAAGAPDREHAAGLLKYGGFPEPLLHRVSVRFASGTAGPQPPSASPTFGK